MTARGAAAVVGWGLAMACVVSAVVVRVVAPAPFLPITYAIGAVMVVSGAGYALSMLAIWLRSRAASR
jgi:hypothetical protein